MAEPYTPGILSDTYDPQQLQFELERLASALEEYTGSKLILEPQSVEPSKVVEGMVVNADGTNWDPGSGAGYYGRVSGAWVFLGSGGAGGSGAWVEVNSTNISGSPTSFTVTWNESLYSDIRIVISGIQCADDGISFQLLLGEANGATIHNTTGDYDGITKLWSTTGWFDLTDSTQVVLTTSTGNAAGEVVNGVIEIFGTHGSNIGGAIASRIYHRTSSGIDRVNEAKAFLETGAGAGAIDTCKLRFFATTERTWANVGNITTYGLTR